ncbi:MAG: hypothetical protein ABWZ63_11275 [Thermoleophilaceae bacterium]
MTVPKRLTAIVYGDGSIEAFRNREDPHEESFEVTDEGAAELLLSIEPVPDAPPDEPPEAA